MTNIQAINLLKGLEQSLDDYCELNDEGKTAFRMAMRCSEFPNSCHPHRKKGHWIVVTRHERYPSGKPYEQLRCPFCKRFDHNGDGNFCGYCGAELR